MKKLYFIILLIASFAIQAQSYYFKRLSNKEENSISTPGLYCLEEDNSGRLWIGLENGGVEIYDGKTVTPLHLEVNPGKDIRALFNSSMNEMWIGSSHNGLTIVAEDTVIQFNKSTGLESNHIRGFVEDYEGRVWVVTNGGGVAVFEDHSIIKTFTTKDGLLSQKNKAVLISSRGEVFVGSDKGITVFQGLKIARQITMESGMKNSNILCLSEDNSGNIWAGTTNGISVVINDTIINIASTDGLHNSRVKSILIDENNAVWVGTRKGVGKIEIQDLIRKRFDVKWFSLNNGLSDRRIRCLYQDESKGIWIGTHFGGINCFFNETYTMYDHSDGMSTNFISVISENQQDSSLWVGTKNGGVNILRNGRFIIIDEDKGLSSDDVNCISHGNSGASYIGTPSGISLIVNSEFSDVWDSYSGVITSNEIISICSDGETIIALSAENELICFKDSNQFVLDPVLLSNFDQTVKHKIRSIYFLQNKFWFLSDSLIQMARVFNSNISIEKEWVVDQPKYLTGDNLGFFGYTANNVLFEINESLTIVDSLDLNKTIQFIGKKNSSTLLLGIDNEIRELFLEEGKVKSYKSYSKNEGFMGMKSNKNAFGKSFDGASWVGAIDGLVRIGNKKYKGVSRDLKVTLEGIVSPQSKESGYIKLNTLPTYKQTHNEYEIEFPAYDQLKFFVNSFHLKNQSELEFKFQVTGEEEITQITKKNNIELDVSSGDYELRVYAKTQWGDWSKEPLVVKFSVLVPFYERTSFIVGVVIGISAICFLIVILRSRQLEKEKKWLEEMINERTKDLRIEQEKSEELLLNILPQEVALELKTFGSASTKKYASASVLFTDFKGFTTMSSEMDPKELVKCLDRIFIKFDEVIERNQLEKIKTIGDAYMCASGIPEENKHHAKNIVVAGLQLLDVMDQFNAEQKEAGKPEWKVRVGVHSGELIAGVVGKKKFAYDIWGDTVNIASRMESNSEPGRVNISNDTYELIKKYFDTVSRGEIEAKNRGLLEMYFVNNIKDEFSKEGASSHPNSKMFN